MNMSAIPVIGWIFIVIQAGMVIGACWTRQGWAVMVTLAMFLVTLATWSN